MTSVNTSINILVIGKTGVGKSSYCNYIFGKDVFSTGNGRPVTGWDDSFIAYSICHDEYSINIYDSVGLEPDKYENWNKNISGFLDNKGPKHCKNPMSWIHTIIYVVSAASSRFEDSEAKIIRTLLNSGIPVHVVLSKCDMASPEQVVLIKERILESAGVDESLVSCVCSVSVRKRSGITSQYGRDESIAGFVNKLNSKLKFQLSVYAFDELISSVLGARRAILDKIDDSNLDIVGLIKIAIQAIKSGDDYDVERALGLDGIEDELSSITDSYSGVMESLDSFLLGLDFAKYSDENDHAYEVIEAINDTQDKVSEAAESIFLGVERKMNEVERSFEYGGFWDKAKMVVQVASVVVNLKGFLRAEVNQVFLNGIVPVIEKQKLIYINKTNK